MGLDLNVTGIGVQVYDPKTEKILTGVSCKVVRDIDIIVPDHSGSAHEGSSAHSVVAASDTPPRQPLFEEDDEIIPTVAVPDVSDTDDLHSVVSSSDTSSDSSSPDLHGAPGFPSPSVRCSTVHFHADNDEDEDMPGLIDDDDASDLGSPSAPLKNPTPNSTRSQISALTSEFFGTPDTSTCPDNMDIQSLSRQTSVSGESDAALVSPDSPTSDAAVLENASVPEAWQELASLAELENDGPSDFALDSLDDAHLRVRQVKISIIEEK
mmetsp:Transcript_11191/g.16800  ORF Transcript_11191/g.16800 Transcript_11191/m.16800 type:complete len:267 (+) Transcript_11191:270-1070(+)